MADYVTLLTSTDHCGPYRLNPSHVLPVLDAARGCSLRIVEWSLQGAPATDLATLGQQLAFPPHFGANFDALFDCLNDAEVTSDNALMLVIGKSEYWDEEAQDTLIAVLQAVSDEWREQGRCFWALFQSTSIDLLDLHSLL